jgi:hypothetical protein
MICLTQSPKWFVNETDQDTNEDSWRFTETYWKCRTDGWPELVDIFGVTEDL